jgi:hypothetical protein
VPRLHRSISSQDEAIRLAETQSRRQRRTYYVVLFLRSTDNRVRYRVYRANRQRAAAAQATGCERTLILGRTMLGLNQRFQYVMDV